MLGSAEQPPLSATTTGKSGVARQPMVFVCPLIVPPTSYHPPARSGGLWCENAPPGKFICMAKPKNRLTTTKLISRRARTIRTSTKFRFPHTKATTASTMGGVSDLTVANCAHPRRRHRLTARCTPTTGDARHMKYTKMCASMSSIEWYSFYCRGTTVACCTIDFVGGEKSLG